MEKRPSYCFSAGIEKEVAAFCFYLQQQGLAAATIKAYGNYVGYFLSWAAEKGLSVEAISYRQLLDYSKSLQQEGRSIKSINAMLGALHHYYQLLLEQEKLQANPATGLRLRGQPRQLPSGLLEAKELELLYEQYPDGHGRPYNERTRRNKVLLGLLVFQGLGSEELEQLQPQHVQLQQGRLFVAATKKGKGGRKSRWLSLQASQVIALQEYLQHIRPQLLEAIRSGKRESQPSRKPLKVDYQQLEAQLFFSLNGSCRLKNSLKHLLEELRKLQPKLKDARQIRRSVLVCWLKEKGIRKVQYLAGHGSISSTERYQAANLEELKEALKQYHPLS